MALCDNIRNSRKSKNMTQKELAKRLGVSHNTISDWESGKHKPDIKNKLRDSLKENNIFDEKRIIR